MFFIFALLLIMIPVYSLAETLPTKINAENLEFRSGVYRGSGGVRISQKERMLSASTLVFDNNTGDVTAYGNVVFTEGNNILSSESLMFNINTNYMRIDKGKIFIRDDNYHIEGDTIEGFSNERFRIESGIFSTCDGEPPCWRFRGEDINVHLNHILTAKGVSFSVRDVPVFYFPYIALPILQARQTGLLIPRIGYNTGEGLKLNTAFFWAISGSQDATFYGDYFGEKGPGGGIEYRYVLSRESGGQFNGYYINDKELDKARWKIKYDHRQLILEESSAKVRINYLNDKTLYKDISGDIGERIQRTQDSDLYVNRRWDSLSAHLWAQYTQNLSGDEEGIFQRMPEAGINVMESRIGRIPFYWRMESSVSRWDEIDTGLTRLHISPAISARLFEDNGFTFIPEIGTEQTFYYMEGETDPVQSGIYNLAGIMSTKLYKSYLTGTGSMQHFIEPSIKYEYTEGTFIDHASSLTNIEGTPPLLDPIEERKEKNDVSLSLVNRLISMGSDRRYEPLYMRLTQIYKIDSPDALSDDSGFSDMRLETVVNIKELFSIDIDATYNHEKGEIISTGTDLGFKRGYTFFTIGQRFSRFPSSLNFLTFSTGITMNKVDTSIDLWYDNEERQLMDSRYSVRYNSQCWGITAFYSYRPEEEEFNVLFTLKGVGSVGGF